MRWIKAAAPVAFGFFAAATLAVAEDGGTWEYRDEWDLAWKIGNFLILVFVIVKFGKAPLTNFLAGRTEEIDSDIKKAETFRDEADAEYREILEEVSKADEKIRELKDIIQAQGEAQKKRILADAEETAERLITAAKASAEFEIRRAHHELVEELVDMAVDIAEDKIRKKLKDKDHNVLVEDYIGRMETQRVA